MSYRLEDLYHYAVTDEVSEETARQAAEMAVQVQFNAYLEEKFHGKEYTLKNVFTAGCCAGRTIRKDINDKIKEITNQ